MPLVKCPSCSCISSVTDSYVGENVKCKKCEHRFIASVMQPEAEPRSSQKPELIEERFPLLRAIASFQILFAFLSILLGFGLLISAAENGQAIYGFAWMGISIGSAVGCLLTRELIKLGIAIEENTRRTSLK